MLRATTACTFWTSQLPKVVRTWCVLYILTSKSASRHNGVHFFDIATSKSGPTLRSFVHFDLQMCFAPQRRAIFLSHAYFSTLRGPKSLEKHSVSRLSYLFTHLHLLSSYSFSSSLLSSNLSLLSASSLLCFSSVHIVGSLTSKLPSTSIFICTVLCIHIYIYTYIHIYIYTYIHVYIYTHIYTYIHIYTYNIYIQVYQYGHGYAHVTRSNNQILWAYGKGKNKVDGTKPCIGLQRFEF